MDLFEAINKRRSIRRYTDEKISDEVIEKALSAAVLAPNSSNTQTWDFYWVDSSDKKSRLVEACLNQSAARMAQHLIVVVADPKKWKRSQRPLIEYTKNINAPKAVRFYYEKLIPFTYSWGFFNFWAPFKWLIAFSVGLFRPITRGPITKRDNQEVAIKSAALAAENFVLAVTAQGFDTCMMEGFDEWRVKRLLKLGCSSRVVMVISVGKGAEKGTWGPRFRLPLEQVIHKI